MIVSLVISTSWTRRYVAPRSELTANVARLATFKSSLVSIPSNNLLENLLLLLPIQILVWIDFSTFIFSKILILSSPDFPKPIPGSIIIFSLPIPCSIHDLIRSLKKYLIHQAHYYIFYSNPFDARQAYGS